MKAETTLMKHGSTWRRLGDALILFSAMIVILAAAGSGATHEIGTARVNAVFHADGRYEISLFLDQATLLARLEGKPIDPSIPEDIIRARLLARRSALMESLSVAFDGREAKPEVQLGPAQGPVLPAIVLTGTAPHAARTFSWSMSLTYGTYSLSLRNGSDAKAIQQWLDGDDTSRPFELVRPRRPRSRLATSLQYLALGFTHIIPKGLDHILFVLGLLLMTRCARPLLAQVTAFTIAHSITLALSVYGIVSLPTGVVEPMIAVSIAYIAVGNIWTREVKTGRVIVVFGFGLLHGLGFAGVLTELGLPRSEFVTALLAFNLGVEAGQLTIIALTLALVGSWAFRREWYRGRIAIPTSAVIAAVGVYWTIERLLA
ncbi:MAG: HupE/UreJ family protein [Acidobacteria bacterium]|nr:HupE/UreJ family protein [Acidobacteriota bacterium]